MLEQKYLKCPYCWSNTPQLNLKQHLEGCSKKPIVAKRQVRKIPENLSKDQLEILIADIDASTQNIEQFVLSQFAGQSLGYFGSSIRRSNKQLPEMDLRHLQNDSVACRTCKRTFYSSIDANMLFYVQGCWHVFCNPCIVKYFDAQFVNHHGNLSCLLKKCLHKISGVQLIVINNVVGEKRYLQMEEQAIRKMMNVVQCYKCKNCYEFIPGNADHAPKKDQNGKILTNQQRVSYSENRFICLKPDCKTEQCKQCRSTPYHTGYGCEQFKSRTDMKKCRYCDEPLNQLNLFQTDIQTFKDICKGQQCQISVKRACVKKLQCGHPCSGINGQVQCLPCLHESCSQKNATLNGQTGDDYCNICFVQALTAAPCIRSSCGHIFHEKCVQKRYQVKWLTPRIIFNFCHCPICRQWISLPPQNPLFKNIQHNIELFNKIQTMSLERLKFEQLLQDKRLTDPQSLYYQKPNEYALAIYAYFMCFKCKKPYFGGRRDCMAADPQESFKPQELICPNCCQIPIQMCPKHGNKFIEFKCKFCCSIAQWFCWGSTHFCEPCHKKQCSGEYLSKYPKQKLPKCKGPGHCPIGGNHKGNGDQKSLGCAICRNYKDNSQKF